LERKSTTLLNKSPILAKEILNIVLQGDSEIVDLVQDSNKECCGGPVGQVLASSGSWDFVTNITTYRLPSLGNGLLMGASYQIYCKK